MSFFGWVDEVGGLLCAFLTHKRTSWSLVVRVCLFFPGVEGVGGWWGDGGGGVEEVKGEIERRKGSADAHVSGSLSALFFVCNIM